MRRPCGEWYCPVSRNAEPINCENLSLLCKDFKVKMRVAWKSLP